MGIEFGVRMSKEDKTKTVFVCMDDTQDIMDKLDPDKVRGYFEYGFKVDMQGIARKKGPDAVVAHLKGSSVQIDYEEGVEVATADSVTNTVKNLNPEDKAKVEEYLRSIGKIA